MKKLNVFLICAFLLFGGAINVYAIDFKISGQWIMSFGYGENGTFEGKYNGNQQAGWGNGQDNFEANQRVRLRLQAIASENLSGEVHFELLETTWGQVGGGALGADGKIVAVKSAFIDWAIPDTSIKTIMGLQNITTPAMASGNSVLNDDMAAVVVNGQFSDEIGLTAFWARPYNDNYAGYQTNGVGPYKQKNFMDNVDAFGLFVPITLDGISITPWGMYAALGPNSFRGDTNSSGDPFANLINGMGASSSYYMAGMLPVGGARHKDFTNANSSPSGRKLTNYGNAWWGGVTGSFSVLDPINIAFDYEYGSVQYPNDGRLNRHGWFASMLVEYKLDWGTPGLYGWYGSGDDSNPANGSERLPALDPNNANNYSYFAFDGAPYLERCALIGNNMAGTWGIGARLNNVSFIDSLSHIVRINYMRGTNSPTMAKKMSLAGLWANGSVLTPNDIATNASLGMPGVYLTSMDSALELGTTNSYQMYENFSINLEAGYIALWLNTDNSVWGARHRNGEAIPQTKDAWNINTSFVYSF